MNVTQVSHSPGGALENAAGERTVLTPVGEPPRRIFRRLLFFRLPAGGLAERLMIDAAVLQARFQPYDYEALSTAEASLRAQVTALDGITLRVELDAPRRVRELRLGPTGVNGPGFTLELYRLDGEAVAGEPTVTARNTLPQVQFIGETGLNGVAIAAGPGGIGGLFDPTRFAVDFTDVRFALRLKNPAGNAVALASGDLLQVLIRSLPSGPRLGIAAPDAPEAAVVFWQAPGEIGGATAAAAGNVDAGDDLAATLTRHLGSFTEIPAAVEVALVIESDAPCMLNVMAFNVAFHLLRESFADESEKQVLRFSGPVRRELTIPAPAGATVLAANIRATPSFRRERPAIGDSQGVLGQDRGVRVEPQRWIAQTFNPPQALAVSGVGLGLIALADGTQLRVELQEDRQGRPSGGTLAGGEAGLEKAGERAWVTVRFAEPVVLPAQPHWLLVTGASGRAVWLADAGAASVRLLIRVRSTLPWEGQSALAGLQPVYRLLSGGGDALDNPPFVLRLGELEATATTDDPELYDLTAALNAYLTADTATAGLVEVPLVFDAAVAGILTVYPPRVEYTCFFY